MPGAVEEMIAKEISGRFVVESDSITLGVTLGTVLRNDPERASYLIVNTGSVDAQLTWQRPGGLALSVPLVANGGSLSLNWREDLVLVTHELLGTVGAGNTTLMTLSVRRVNS